MSYLEMAERVLGERKTQPQFIGCQPRAVDVARLRSRLAELRHRIDKGFEVLRAREEAGKTGGNYPLWLETWERLLDKYTSTADKLASLTGCPIGDCSRMDECKAAPTACPAVGEGNAHAL